MTTTKEKLAKFRQRRIKRLEYNKDGATEVFYIQSMTEVERADFNESFLSKTGELDPEKTKLIARKLICMCLVEEDGTNVFIPNIDEPQLNELDSNLTIFLREAIDNHCGLVPKKMDADDPKKS